MLQSIMRVGAREFLVPPTRDIDVLVGEITEHVQAGGGFVNLIDTPEHTTRVLVAPGISVVIETIDVGEVEDIGEVEPTGAPVEQTWLDLFDY